MTLEDEPKKIDDLIIEEDERPEGDYESGLSEQEEATATISDFKALMRELNPPLKNKRLQELLSTSRVTRIFPDNLLDKAATIIAMVVLEQKPYEWFDFAAILNHTQDALGFGYEGRGISDLLEAFGAVKEQELDRLSEKLGIG